MPSPLKKEGYLPHPLVNNHYKGWQVGDFITSYNLPFYEGCVVKYVCRHSKKDGKKDLIKARDYINKLLEYYK